MAAAPQQLSPEEVEAMHNENVKVKRWQEDAGKRIDRQITERGIYGDEAKEIRGRIVTGSFFKPNEDGNGFDIYRPNGQGEMTKVGAAGLYARAHIDYRPSATKPKPPEGPPPPAAVVNLEGWGEIKIPADYKARYHAGTLSEGEKAAVMHVMSRQRQNPFKAGTNPWNGPRIDVFAEDVVQQGPPPGLPHDWKKLYEAEKLSPEQRAIARECIDGFFKPKGNPFAKPKDAEGRDIHPEPSNENPFNPFSKPKPR